VNPLDRKLQALRRRLRLGRAAEAAARGAFYASLAACALLAVSRIAGLAVPGAVAWGGIAAVSLALALREAGRSFTRRDCAIQLDRMLGLDERLSTAVDVPPGPMREALWADASAALARAALPPRRLPREARLLGGSALLIGAILLIRTPASAGGSEDPALEAVTQGLQIKLEELGADRIEFREIRKDLQDRRLEDAAGRLRALADKLEQERLQGGGGAQADRDREAATAGAAALSAELARLGRPIHAAPPSVVALKVERQRLGAAPPTPFSADEQTVRAVATLLERADWAPRYDAVIRRYYGSESR
jgi:hypothetical protein